MLTSDRIYPLCELLLGAAYADAELHDREKTEIRALMTEMAGEQRVEVEACLAAFEPERFDMQATARNFRDDPEADRRRLLRRVSTVSDADDELARAGNDTRRALAEAPAPPPPGPEGLTLDIDFEEVKDTFQAVRKGPPPTPPRPPAS